MKVFDLFIYSIIALIIIAIFLAIAQNFPPLDEASTMIKKALDEARIDPNLGKVFLVGTLNYEKDGLISSSGLTLEETLTSIECTNPEICCIRKSEQNQNEECKKAFEWDYDFINSKESKKVNTFVRCIDIDKINSCKVYIGLMPSQTKVNLVEIIGENARGNTEIKAILENIGQTTLANATAHLKLLKKVNQKWIQTDYELDSKEILILQPSEEKTLYWEIQTINLGEYKATILFEAKEGGFNENSVEFTKTKNSFCKKTNIGETIYNAENDNYEELHHCEGCNYANECANEWNKESNETYYPKSKDYAYCIKNTPNENC